MFSKEAMIVAILSLVLGTIMRVDSAVVSPTIDTSSYHHYNDMNNLLVNLAASYPDLARVYDIGTSVQGRKLLVIQISDKVNQREVGEPRFKYIANMHGNEPVGREILLYLAQYLLYNYGIDPAVTSLVDNTDIHLMPSMNPDGFERSAEGDCYSVSGRTNANGVDLNRNFPDQFSTNTGPIQQETIAVINWLQTKPQFVLSANLHGGSLVANYPYDDSASHISYGRYSMSPDDVAFRNLAQAYASSHPTMHLGNQCDGTDNFPGGITNGAEWYDVSGGMQDFNYLHSNTFEITVEQSCCKYPTADRLQYFWNQNKNSMLDYLKKVHVGVKGIIQNTQGIPIENAEVHVSGINHVIKSSDKGEYWRILAPGTYTVSFVLSGYTSVTTTVQVSTGPAVVLNVNFNSITKQGSIVTSRFF
uniref:Peptidase M14 domain-containing protein n=1 Tax=Arion vulgaris TaxID=1028688 RepID=A0A0B6YSD7_9EUPU